METIKLKNGETKFRESFRFNGVKTNSPSFTRKHDAIAWKRRLETEKYTKLSLGEHYKHNDNQSFYIYSQSWLQNHVRINCSVKTYSSYESILRVHLYPYFETLKLSQICEHHGVMLMSNLKQTHQPKGIKNIWIVLKAIINRSIKDRIITLDPFDNIKMPKVNLNDDCYWDKLGINQFLLANTHDVLYPLFFVAIHTGLRLGELCGLKWDRIDFQNNLISVTRTRDKTGFKETTKTKMKRHVPMTLEVRSILLRLHSKGNANQFVFLENNGNEVSYTHIYRRFHLSQAKAGITNKIHFHALRHTFSSNFMMNGGNVFDLQKLLGHTEIKMTMRYAHFTPKHLQNSLQFMNMSVLDNENVPVMSQRDLNGEDNLRILAR